MFRACDTVRECASVDPMSLPSVCVRSSIPESCFSALSFTPRAESEVPAMEALIFSVAAACSWELSVNSALLRERASQTGSRDPSEGEEQDQHLPR